MDSCGLGTGLRGQPLSGLGKVTSTKPCPQMLGQAHSCRAGALGLLPGECTPGTLAPPPTLASTPGSRSPWVRWPRAGVVSGHEILAGNPVSRTLQTAASWRSSGLLCSDSLLPRSRLVPK